MKVSKANHPRIASRFHYWRALMDLMRFPSRYDYYRDYIKRVSKGSRFLDLGGMWLVNGEFSFYAEECGASEVTLLDILPPTEVFLNRVKTSGSKVKYIQCDIMDPTLAERVGQYDVIMCCGVVYHLPDPLQGLVNLRKLSSGKTLVGSAIIPEGITQNRAVYYPYMDSLSRARWNFMARRTQQALAQYNESEGYANWYWGLSASCLESLLRTSGFGVDAIHYRKNFAFFECHSNDPKI